ncbi:hypothetical protein ACYSNX_02725 [Myroides sp. LJL115]
MKTREELEDKAQEMMRIHNLDAIHLTTDGQGFTDKERAITHSNLQKNKSVYFYQRKTNDAIKLESKEVDNERIQLSEKYEKLYNNKPRYNMGLEKLRQAIVEKESEIENHKEATEEGTNTSTDEEQSSPGDGSSQDSETIEAEEK